MAGLAINAPSRPPLHHTKLKPPQLISPYSLPSADSSFFCLRLSLCSSTKFDSFLSLSASRRPAIDARYGSGGINRSDDEQALNMSSIRSDNVRLIDEQQNMVGVVSKSVAIQMAEDAELDLVVVSPDADPPVVRIMDFDKYRYELQKKKREQQKKSAASRMDLKELKMGYNIDVHDYSVRLKAAQKFLKDGDKVKIIVNLKGRENAFRSKAIELIKQFKDDIGELMQRAGINFRYLLRIVHDEHAVFMELKLSVSCL